VKGLVDVLTGQGRFLRSDDGQLWFWNVPTRDLKSLVK